LTESEKTAVLLLAHGSPVCVDDIPEFLLHVTGGRPLPTAVIEEVKHRYGLIGASPLTCWTFEQRDLLASELGLPVYVGMRNWKPFIDEAVLQMRADGIRRVIVICLAPQNSRTSVGLYRLALSTNREATFAIDFIESWHDHPLLISAFAEKLRAAWSVACAETGTKVPVIFTAHSVPQRTVAEGDPYETQAKETAALVAREAALEPGDWTFAFQSQGMSGGPWLGPTVEAVILDLKQKGHGGVFIQPVGFVSDHVEVLFDIDIGFKGFAEQQGMRLWRAESLNGSKTLTAALADLARAILSRDLTKLNQGAGL
jgi:protoporphyrin/coproporphyrin ferrochelatase